MLEFQHSSIYGLHVEIELYLSLSLANSKHILAKCDDSL